MSVSPGTPGRPSKPVLSSDRWRLRATVSVHPSTLRSLDELCEKFRTNRGRLVDKMVETLSAVYKDNSRRCFDGSRCTMNRTDVPEVL